GPTLARVPPAGLLGSSSLSKKDYDPRRKQYAQPIPLTLATPRHVSVSAMSTENALRQLDFRLWSGGTSRSLAGHDVQLPDLSELMPVTLTAGGYALEVVTRFGELPGGFQI